LPAAGGRVFERFTYDARRIVVYAQEECRILGDDHIGTEHLLLGLLYGDTPTGSALQAAGVTLAGLRKRLEQLPDREKKELPGHPSFTPQAKQVLEQSLRHAQRLGQGHIAPPHLLRAVLDVPDGLGARTLAELGVDLDALAARADEIALAGDLGSG
jgi:ATP-dependent Clp protease ATP-binding subunit ClpC